MSDNHTTQWTAWAEAISFVSATLGEPFCAAQGNGLYWGTFAPERPDGSRGYPVGLHRIGSKVNVMVNFDGIAHADAVKLWAIIGWATEKKHLLETNI